MTTGDASELRWTQVAPKKEISSDSGDAGNPLHAEPTCVFTIDEILDGDPSLSLSLSLETCLRVFSKISQFYFSLSMYFPPGINSQQLK